MKQKKKKKKKTEKSFFAEWAGERTAKGYIISIWSLQFFCACVSTKEGVRGIETRSNDDETRTTSGASC